MTKMFKRFPKDADHKERARIRRENKRKQREREQFNRRQRERKKFRNIGEESEEISYSDPE